MEGEGWNMCVYLFSSAQIISVIQFKAHLHTQLDWYQEGTVTCSVRAEMKLQEQKELLEVVLLLCFCFQEI